MYSTLKVLRYITLMLLLLVIPSMLEITSCTSEAIETPTILINLDITIDGGSVELITRALNVAEFTNAKALILKINSYGGYLGATDTIVKKLIESDITCYAWIPPGGKAVSAASLIALACNKIYMGEGGSVGAAMPYPSDEKTVNYVASRFRSLAERQFNGNETLIDISERFVKENLVLTAEEAYKVGFAYKANTLSNILEENNLYIVEEVEPSFWEQIVSLISSPLIAPIMLAVGTMLIFAEVLITGFQGYVVAGILLIMLSLYGMAVVTPNLLITILLILGLMLLVTEMYAPGFGVFGVSGFIVTALGVFMLLYGEPYKVISLTHIAFIIGLISFAGFMVVVFFKAATVMRKTYLRFEEKLVGKVGIVKTTVKPKQPGIVYVNKEDWTAYSVDDEIPPGEEVVIVKVKGLKLYVKKVVS